MGEALSTEWLSRKTGIADDQLRAWQELGLLHIDDQGHVTADAVERIRTIRFAVDRGITPEQIADLADAQRTDMLGRYIDLLGGSRPLGRSVEEAAKAVGLPLPLARRFWLEIGRGDEEVFDDDLQMLKVAAAALHLGLPEEALLQIVRVYADSLTRVADAQSRLFHIHVHEQLRASTGLSEAELVEQIRAMSDPLLEMVEPSILYFHRRAWREAILEDMVVHLRDDLQSHTREVGEVPVAVLFVDLAAFTPLTEAMGDVEAVRVLDRFSHLVRQAAHQCNGRMLKQIGDEFMIAFPNAPAAVRCGLAIRSQAAAEPHFPAVRMGSHSGTALYREADYLGATVNTAARVAGEAGRGEFLVTDAVMTSCELKQASFRPAGDRLLKGISNPVSLFVVASADDSALRRVGMQRPVDKYLFDHPEIWEQTNESRFDREPPFLAEVFRRYGSVQQVLDVGCGTGGHLDRLSRLGLAGTGVDLNERMIDYARTARPNLQFHVADMRALPFADEFDAVMCLCTTFSYNTTNEDIVAALGAFHRALRPGGLVVIDVFNPIGFIETRGYLEEIEQVWEPFNVRCVTAHDIDETRQVQIATQSVFRLDDGQLLQRDITEFRLFFPQELRYFLETHGFRFLSFYGGFDVESTSLKGSRLIALAQKP